MCVWDGDFRVGASPNAVIKNNGSAFFNGSIGVATNSPTERIDIGIDSKVNVKIGRWASLGITGGGLATIIGSNVKASNVTDNTMEYMTTTVDGAKAIKMQYNEGISFHTLLGNVTQGEGFEGYERMRINNEGNVLIGKTTQVNPTYKLDVEGKVRAHEIVVNTTGADYVFEEDYNLKSLTEVEKFIQNHHHLPGIKPAKEMEEDGVSVAELNTKLLEKIEELTLHMIQMEKELRTLKNTSCD